MRAGIRCAVGWLTLALCAAAAPYTVARGQESLAGTWQAGATTVDVSVDSWGKDCGPRPESMRSGGGGSVQVEQQGQRLVVRAQDRVLQSDRCASPNPALRRISTGKIGNTWTTRCRTDAQDPRQEVATYTLELLSPDRLRYRDQSHFDWRLHASTCKATITTTQLLERRVSTVQAPAGAPGSVGSATGVSAPASQATPAAPSTPGCVPGPPARLSLRPARVELALGERTCFEARAVDARGCPIPDASVRFALEHGPGVRAELDGRCFRAAERSAEGEGVFRVLANASGARAEAEVRVSAEQLPSLIAARVQSSAIEGIPDGEQAGQAAPPAAASAPSAQPAAPSSRVAARATPDSSPPTRRLLLLGLALLLVLVAVAFVLRRERTPAAKSAAARVSKATVHAERSQAALDPAPDATSAPTSTASAATPTDPLRCPRCGARFALGSAFCGVDGERLVTDP